MKKRFMTWFRLITWCWWNYFKPTEKDIRTKLKLPITLLFSILLYTFVFIDSSKIICIFLVVAILLIVYSPKLILLGIGLFFVYIIATHLINIKPLTIYIDGKYIVVDHIKSGSIIRVQGQNVLIHSKIQSHIGDLIKLNGWIKPVKNHNAFDAISYLKTHKVSSEILTNKLVVVEYSRSFLTKTRTYIEQGGSTWKSIGPMLLLGEVTNESKEVFNISKRLSILHLFVISGFHIGIIYKIITFIAKKIKLPSYKLFSLLPIIFYVFLLNWTIPATRALFFIILTTLVKSQKKYKINHFDTLGVVGMVLVSLNPYIIQSLSFQLTFIATTTIIYLNSFKMGLFYKYLLINIGVFLSTLPIISSMNGWVSLWGIFYSVSLTPLISFLYIISILFLPLKNLLEPAFKIIILILKIFDKTVIIIKINTFSNTLTYNYYIIFTICILFMEKRTSLLAMKKNALLQNSV